MQGPLQNTGPMARAGLNALAGGRAESLPGAAATDLIGKDRRELADDLRAIGVPEKQIKMRVAQLWRWLYVQGTTDFGAMSSISRPVQQQLNTCFKLTRPTVSEKQVSSDGTIKWLLGFDDKREVETVYIPETDRGALCMSSQVGCTLTCSFCHTGTQKLVRNLTAREILLQFMLARDHLAEWPKPKGERKLSNIVMMGMGEPLLNFDAVAKALTIIMDGDGIGLSRRRITLSTSGIVPMMQRCGDELGVNLAVSLHAVTDAVRDILVPINRRYPIAELLDACRRYPGSSNSRRITFEYVMLKQVNDSDADARALVRLLKGIPAKINLIPFNPWPGSQYECSSNRRLNQFAEIVNDAGYSAPIRTPRGRDIMAACGQLKSLSLHKKSLPA